MQQLNLGCLFTALINCIKEYKLLQCILANGLGQCNVIMSIHVAFFSEFFSVRSLSDMRGD